MSQYSKPFRVEVSGGYVQPGEHYVCGVLFVDSLSAGCPDARTLATAVAGRWQGTGGNTSAHRRRIADRARHRHRLR